MQIEGTKSRGLGAVLIVSTFFFILFSMQSLSALSNQPADAGLQGFGNTSGDSQGEGLDLLAVSTRFVDSNAGRSFRLIGLPVYVYGYLGNEKSNLTLITDGITDNRGRINFFLPAGSYTINFRYQLFGSNVTIDLPLTRSIVELDWTVSRRTLEPITLMFTDRYAVGELGPGDIIDVYFPGEEERLPVVVNVGPTLQTAIEPDPNFLLDVKGGLQSNGSQWVQLSPANEVMLKQMDPKIGVDYTAYWVTVREATRPWR